MTRATLIHLNPDEHNDGLRHYLSIITLDKYSGSCNTIGQISGRTQVPNKTEKENLEVFNMMKQTDKSKTLIKHISCNF